MTRKALEDGPDEQEARESLSRLAKAIVGLVKIPDRCDPLPRQVRDNLTTLANLISQCRSAIERDGRTREIEGVPFREEGPRLARQLASLFRGLLAIGNTEQEAWMKVRRVGLDSMPELRRRAILALSTYGSPERTSTIARVCNCPPTTTKRALEDLAYLGLLHRYNPENHEAETWELADKTREALEGVSFDLADDEPPFDLQGIIGPETSPEIGISSASIISANTGHDSRVSLPKGRRKALRAPEDTAGREGNGLAASQ
jgi:DNA-binding MarR family transcriptional regulator